MTKEALFTAIVDALCTYLGTQYATYNIFQGSKTIGDVVAAATQALSVNISNWVPDPNGQNGFWILEINVIYMKYDPNATDSYDVVADAEKIIDKIETHLNSQYNTSPNQYGGRNVGGKVWSITEDSKNYLYGCEMTFKINVAEVV